MWVRQERAEKLVFLVIGGSAFSVTNIFCSQTQFAIRDWHIGTISSHPSFHQFASMHAIIIPPPSIATIMPMSCPQQKPVLGIRRITSIVLLDVLSSCGTLAHCRNLLFHIHKFADSAFLRASSEPIAIMKAHAPQLPFRKVHFLEQQQLRMNDYFSPRRGSNRSTAQVLTSQHYQHKDGGRWLLSSVLTTSRCISENDIGLVRFFRRTFEQMVESGGHAFLTQGRQCRSIQSSHYGT
jgi:hypothetical protein